MGGNGFEAGDPQDARRVAAASSAVNLRRIRPPNGRGSTVASSENVTPLTWGRLALVHRRTKMASSGPMALTSEETFGTIARRGRL
jgi:hypothetical protein